MYPINFPTVLEREFLLSNFGGQKLFSMDFPVLKGKCSEERLGGRDLHSNLALVSKLW